jgi:hypothetical protein
MPILPAVAALELMAETALLALGGTATPVLESVVIETAMKLAPGRRAAVRCEAVPGAADGTLELTLRTDFIGRGGRLLDPDRTLVLGRAQAAPDRPQRSEPQLPPIAGRVIAFVYPEARDDDPKASRIYHGPPFRGLSQVILGPDTCHTARIVAPPASGLRRECAEAGWLLPAPAIDCCLQACGVVARAKLSALALPGSFGRVSVLRHPEPGEACTALITQRGHEQRRIHFDFTLLGEDGRVVLSVEDYVAHTFEPIR